MATIQEYLTENTKARNSVATLQRKIRQAYDAAQASTRAVDNNDNPVGYDRLDMLVDEEVRSRFKNTLSTALTDDLQAAVNALPEDNSIADTLLMNGFYGFTMANISDYVDQMKDNLNFDGFIQFLGEKTRHNETLQSRLRSAQEVLDQVAAPEVLEYVGLDANPEDHDKVTLQIKSDLVGQFDQIGSIPTRYLEDKPYLRPRA